MNKCTTFRQRLGKKLTRYLPQITIVMLILLFILVYFAQNIFISVKPGEAGVLWRRFFGGTVVDTVYPEGFHIIFPWNKMYIYNVRIQEYPCDFVFLTKEGLQVNTKVSIFYHPEYALIGVLHQRIGPDYAKNIILPEIEAQLRYIVGRISAEDLYTTQGQLIAGTIGEAAEQLAQRFVRLDDVLLKKVTLPESVEKAIRYKIEQKHFADAFIFKIEKEKREAERKRIEAQGIKAYNEIVTSSLSEEILKWMGIQATLEISKSDNAKVVVIGSGKDGLPIILGGDK